MYVSSHTCVCLTLVHVLSCSELNPRVTADAFYNGELEDELRLLVTEHPSLQLCDFPFNTDADREPIMEQVETFRAQSIYPHHNCTNECQERG